MAAMIYPATLFVLALSVLVFLLVFFIPRFQMLFEGFDAPLPPLTVAIVSLSGVLRRYGLWLAAGAAIGIGALRRRLRDEARRRALEHRLLRLPVVGELARSLAVSRFCRMLGALLSAGVTLVQALRAARRSLGYQTLIDLLDEALEGVQKGESLAAALGRSGSDLFSRATIEMVAVAEESGRLDRELVRVADEMERTLDRRMRTAVALAEPAMLFLIAAFVGVIFIGMVLPIFTLQEYIR
jgi:type II secretory pathway component PulF